MPDPISAVVTLLATQAVARIMESGEWETLKQRLQQDDRPGAVAQVDHALDSLDAEKLASIANLDANEVEVVRQRMKEDARYEVLAIAQMEDRSIISTVLGLQSAEKVGENLTRATECLTGATEAAGRSLAAATQSLTSATEAAGRDLTGATQSLRKTTWWLVAASGALVLATVALVIITAIKA